MQSQYNTTCLTCGKPFHVKPSVIRHGGGQYCSLHCRASSPLRLKPPEQRFWAKVAKTTECWLWQGAKTNAGYGKMGMPNNQWVLAHRFSYALHVGPIPDGMFVCHHCDNPSCVRPDHLFLGTNKDNTQDRVSKGRKPYTGSHWTQVRKEHFCGDNNPTRLHPECVARGDKHGLHKHPECAARGEYNGTAKLTKEAVVAIREQYAAGGVTQKQLARQFGVHEGSIGRIVRMEGWRHI